ncbi:MAG: triose-phosphate isomerase [Xanthomonadales bacterium]|nr:triose-phosphate isomerase [Xanthomonadales bacterium]
MSRPRRSLVAGNWKMHGSRAANASLLQGVRAVAPAGVEIVLCPPFVYLPEAAVALAGSAIGLGAQDLSAEAGQGAYTGEIGGAMLRDVGCSHVIVGHSERRARHKESDAEVARKAVAALAAGLVPIVCVGETLEERDAGATPAVVGRQLAAVLDGCGVDAFRTLVIAYEPVWAIGTGRTASPEQAQEIHAFLRGLIASRDATIAGSARLLYGGSVKAGNAAELFAMPDIDGGLIGGASLKVDEFAAILAAAPA